jgi:electron-transferring-flavoprotein dehydrogenase
VRSIDYPKPDGSLTFDRLSVFVSNTNHEENQPAHLTAEGRERAGAVNLATLRRPGEPLLPGRRLRVRGRTRAGTAAVINAQNCVHCKTCDIKDPTQNIVWVTPEGGGGPNYAGM